MIQDIYRDLVLGTVDDRCFTQPSELLSTTFAARAHGTMSDHEGRLSLRLAAKLTIWKYTVSTFCA